MNYDILLSRIEKLSQEKGILKTYAYIQSGVGKDFGANIAKKSKPSIEKIQALATYFGVSIDYLVGNTDYPYIATANKAMPLNAQATELSEREIAVALAYRNCPAAQPSIDYILGLNRDEHQDISVAAKGGHFTAVADKAKTDSAVSEAFEELNEQIKKKY